MTVHATLEAMDRTTPVAAPDLELEPDYDHVVVLHNISWDQYTSLNDARGESAHPRMAYLDGTLEIMSTSFRHEVGKTLIARLVEAFAEERDVEATGMGSTTFRKKALQAGLEPDECYCIDRIKKVPDLALEVIHTSGGVDKLEIYRRLGVREVWFWVNGKIWVYRLVARHYKPLTESEALAGIDLDDLARIVTTTDDAKQTSAVRAYRRSLTRRR